MPTRKKVHNQYPGCNVKLMMTHCGKDSAAEKIARELIAHLGWHPLAVGGLEQALHLEHRTPLWVRMVRVNSHSPNMVWAMLIR